MTRDNKIRILHLRASRFIGGPEKQILHHAQTATTPEREIWIGSFRDGPARSAILERAEQLGLPILELGSGRFNPLTILELARKLRHAEISVLCTHGYKANLIGWGASRLTGCPQIAYARGWTEENLRIKLYDWLDRSVLRRTNWVVCVSKRQAERLGLRGPGLEPPLVVANAALFGSQQPALPIQRAPIRKALGLEENALLICAAGRLSVEKGHRYLLHAMPCLVRAIPNLRLVLLGEDKQRSRLEEDAKRLGVESHILFAGFKEDILPWIQACDVLINPSLSEGLPNVVLEAMAVGTPVVATAVGGVPDLIEDGQTGILVPPASSAALANAVCRLSSNPDQALELARHARVRLEAYSPAKHDHQLVDLYARVVESPAKAHAPDSVVLPTRL